jgi:glycosyltransferase involved in cell wall biosynthesis
VKPAVLFVHNAFPGQFGDLAAALAARGVDVAAIGEGHAPGVPGIKIARYAIPRSSTPGIFPLAAGPEADMIRAVGALDAARELKAQGFAPQVIVGHATWGETLLLHEAFPDARQVIYPEFFPRGRGLQLDFDPEFPPSDQQVLSTWALGAPKALALTDADAIVCPTEFQASMLPDVFRPRVRIIHEGIDVDAIRPGLAPRLQFGDGRTIEPGQPVITHINNHLEPVRGLHIFARALPRVLEVVPNAQVMIFGHERALSYSGPPPEGAASWKEACLRGVDLDPARVHFIGYVPFGQILGTLRASAAHVYYSYPFVLSWSVLQAMAAGCYVIGSDTAPVREVIEDGVNGRLLPFFDVGALSQALIEACRDPAASAPMRAAARETAERYSTANGRAGWLALLAELGVKVEG